MLLQGTGNTAELLGVIGEVFGMAEEDLVALAVELLREERRSDPGSFDAVWAQLVGAPVPDWLRQEP